MMKSFSIFTKNSLQSNNDKSLENKRLGFAFEKRFEEQIQKRKITKPYQFFGIWIAQNLGDTKNIPLFVRLAKNQDKILLESAVSYVKDYPNARSRTHLFLWFLKGKLEKVKKLKSYPEEELTKKSLKLTKKKKIKTRKVELIGQSFDTIPNYKKVLEDTKNIEKFFEKEKVESDIQILNPKEYLFEKLINTRKFENNISQNFYLNIYKFDMFSENFNIAIDIIDDRDMTLSKKAYFDSKKRFALSNKVKYKIIPADEITANYTKVLKTLLS